MPKLLAATVSRRESPKKSPEEIATGVFGVGNAVSHQNQAIPGVQTDVVALVGGIGQQADGQVAMGRANHLVIADQQRRHVAAVHVFHLPITLKPRNDQGRVFLADMLVGEESVGRSHNLLQGHSGEKLGIDHALKGGSQQRGGNSLAADIGQHLTSMSPCRIDAAMESSCW